MQGAWQNKGKTMKKLLCVAVLSLGCSSAWAGSSGLVTAVRAEPKEALFVSTPVPHVFSETAPSWMEKVAAGQRLSKPLVCRDKRIAAAALRWIKDRKRSDFNGPLDPRSCQEDGKSGVVVQYAGVTAED